MSVKIAPSPRQQFEDGNGLPYSGAKLFTYVSGSTTKQATYTTSVGDTANSNPIVLDSAGRTPYGVWLTAGLSYKFVLAPSTDTDPPTSPIFTEDNIAGVNDTAVTTSEWKSSGLTPTYISATQFSVVGDQTTDFHVDRRIKLTISAGTVYGTITVSAYTTLTTVTVLLDSGVLDSGLSAADVAVLSAVNNSIPRGVFDNLDGASFSDLVNFAAGANIASATTIDLTAATGNCPRITGTSATSAVTMNTGQQMLVVADEAWPLTYNATTNKLDLGASYTCVAGDVILYHKDLSGVVHGTIFSSSPWSDYSASSTIVGWSSFTVKEIYTRKIGSLLFVNYRLQGTSNATGATFTLPFALDGLTYSSSAYIIDNGSAQTAPGWVVSTAASATITVSKDMSGAAFTASGTKAVRGQFFAHIA